MVERVIEGEGEDRDITTGSVLDIHCVYSSTDGPDPCAGQERNQKAF